MKRFVFIILLGFVGCDKVSTSYEKGQAWVSSLLAPKSDSGLTRSPEYAKNYQEAQARAVREFPALGVAGSPLNNAFLVQANEMKERGAAETKSPDWPYTLAVKVNAQLSEARHKMLKPGSRLTVAELQALNPPPAGATVSGHVTNVAVGFAGKTANITLDGSLRCEIVDQGYGGAGTDDAVWVQDGNVLKLKKKPQKGDLGETLMAIALGELVVVEGSFNPQGTTKLLRGVMRRL